MKNMKTLNLKNMKETQVNYSGTQEEMNKIWDTLYQMVCLGFISNDLWMKFSDECQGWVIEGNKVIDTRHGDRVVYEYDLGETYRA